MTEPPEKGGTVAERIRAAMQPPARVPAKSPPASTELVTRPDGANVTMTLAVPAGSPSLRQEDAEAAARLRAARAALVLKGALLLLVEAPDAPPLDLVLAAFFPTNEDLLLLEPAEASEVVAAVLLAARALGPEEEAAEATFVSRALASGALASGALVSGALALDAVAGCSFEGTL
ncbi:MAG: hypothetical protein JW940_04225 [Polyangiaceae bacterium]|nr:hypothetical protein [Polyangiaceae bacterium]